MDTVDQSFGFLSNLNLTIPLSQIVIFAVFSALCLISGKHKVGLLAAYGFLFYWVFILNQGFFMKQLEKTAGGVYIYGAIGFVTALIGFLGFLKKTE
jgi:hypothetical protein